MIYNTEYDEQLRELIFNHKLGYFTLLKRNKKYKYLYEYVLRCSAFLDQYETTKFHVNLASRCWYTLNHRDDILHCCVCGRPILINYSVIFHDKLDISRLHCSIECAMKDPITQLHIEETFEEHYGNKILFKTDHFKTKTKTYMNEHFGVDQYMETTEFREKSKITLKKSYGVEYFTQTEEYKQYMKEHPVILSEDSLKAKDFNTKTTCMSRYGVISYSQTPMFKQLWSDPVFVSQTIEKEVQTKIKNGTINTSKPEDDTYHLLSKIFGISDVVRQYKSNDYPFHCDFYIISLDLYIECNYSWTHGPHFFDPTLDIDQELLKKWKSKKSKYYSNAIKTWTQKDILKRDTAIKNGINYLVFWTYESAKSLLDKVNTSNEFIQRICVKGIVNA